MDYGCIGKKLPHSFSKEIHGKIGGYSYALRELSEAELPDFMRKKDFKGINVTIPYKEAVIPFLDELDPMAKAVGAVNTVIRRGERLCGYNTDVAGMERLLEKTGLSLTGKKVLILGTGGTSKTANAVARRANAKEAVTVSRTAKTGAVTYEEAYAVHKDAEIIINTTPCGMYPAPDAMPVDPARFPALSGVIDAVYNPLETKLVSAALKRGVKAACGLYMLVAQAVAAYEIFMDKKAEADLSDRIYAALLREKQNVVLTGMPGSGKSTVGRQIARDTGRRFIDTDDLIEKRTGEKIVEIFRKNGEDCFRSLEAEAVGDVSLLSGIVISTGGGAVLRETNVEALKRNGRLYYLDRPTAFLIPTDDRPLANTREAVEQRYKERRKIYLDTADEVIPVENDAVTAAKEIERRHGYETTGDQRTESESAGDP